MPFSAKSFYIRLNTQSNGEIWFGLLLGMLAITYFCFAVFRIDYLNSKLIRLSPYPDALEYYSMARSMARGGPPKIQIGEELLPSRYPPGYSVLMLPWIKILSEKNKILAPFRTNQTLGLFFIVCVWIYYWRLGKPLAGGVSAMLLATLPIFIIYSRSSLSEISGVILIAFAAMAVAKGLILTQRRWIYLCAFFLGMAVNTRLQLIFFGPLLVAMALIKEKNRWTQWLLHCVLILVAFALCASPIFIINYFEFGNPFLTGYDFWVPGTMSSESVFSIINFWPSALVLWNEFSLMPQVFSVSNIFGNGTHFTPALPILSLIGCASIKNWKLALSIGLAWISSLFGIMLYFYHDSRMFITAIVLLIPTATVAICKTLELVKEKKYFKAAPLLILSILCLLGFPSVSKASNNILRSQFIEQLTTKIKKRPAVENIAAKEFGKLVKAKKGLVISRINPVLLNELLPKEFIAAPLDGIHVYSQTNLWKYSTREATDLISKQLALGNPVYALFVPGKELEKEIESVPKIANYQWVPLKFRKRYGVVLMLVPLNSGEK